MRRALIVIDMLNDFTDKDAPLYVPDNWKIIPEVKRNILGSRSRGEPVIFVCDSHALNDPEFHRWPPHAVGGTRGAQIVGELEPEYGDIIIKKTTYSSFQQTGLEEKLTELEIGTVRITGCLTNICVMYTAFECVVRGYCVEVVRDAVAGIDKTDHEWALKHMDTVLGARII
jgi:nicotinamidase-related amidase